MTEVRIAKPVLSAVSRWWTSRAPSSQTASDPRNALRAEGLTAVCGEPSEALRSHPRLPMIIADDRGTLALTPGHFGGWRATDERGHTYRYRDGIADHARAWVYLPQLTGDRAEVGLLIRRMVRASRWSILSAIVFGLLGSTIAMALPMATFYLAIRAIAGSVDTAWMSAGIGIAALVGAWLVMLARDRVVTTAQHDVQGVVEPAIWGRLLSLPSSYLRRTSLRTILSAANGIAQLRSMLGPSAVEIAVTSAFSVLSLGALAVIDWRIGAAACLVCALVLGAIWLLSRKQDTHDREVFAALDDIQAMLYPALQGIEEIHVYGAEQYVYNRYRAAFEHQKLHDLAGMRYENASAALATVVQFVMLGSVAPVIVIVGLSTVQSLLVVLCCGAVAGNLARLRPVLPALFAAGPVLDRLRVIVDEPPESSPRARAISVQQGEIALHNCSFRYPGTEAPILDGIDLRVAQGEFVGIVGPSGCGKSTILRLILGLERPSEGRVCIDGVDLADVLGENLRAQIGYVPQDVKLLRGSIRDIVLGATDLDPNDPFTERVIHMALDRSGLLETVERLPLGLDTRINDVGGTLSGGQAQRLLLARAIAKRPQVLVLDEATSALDDGTQSVITEMLGDLPITRVVVAHRPEALAGADRILALRDGRLVPVSVTECAAAG